MKVEPIVLEGEFVRLEPFSFERHFADLSLVALDEDLWRWTVNDVRTTEDLQLYFEIALREQASGVSLPFATIEKSFNKAVGSTRFGSISVENSRVEIGWTWIGRNWQRTFVNTEAKFLMLKHAFEAWNCNRVELKTDLLNLRSRAAILRLGATEEGTLRKHTITQTGRIRDTVYFSIVKDEWPQVKVNLKAKLDQSK